MQVGLESILLSLRQRQKLIPVGGYRYDMRHIVMSLNNSCVDVIKQEFHFNENRLDLLRFVWLMRQALDHDPQDHFVSYELVKLFEEIDIDQSETIEWAQFLEYLSQSNWLSTPTPPRVANARDGSLLVHAFHEEAKYRKFPLRRVVEVARHSTLALLATNHSLSFLNLDRAGMGEQKSAFVLSHVDCTRVLAMDYAQEERLFGVLLTNRNLIFVEDGEMQKTLGVVRSSGNEVDVKYLPLHKLWVVQSVNSSLQVFSPPHGGQLTNRVVFRPHEQPLTGLREVGWPLTLCTASLDGLLKLWQVGTGRLVIELDVGKERGEVERKGIKGVATYNRAGVAYLCSWMFTSEIFLWLPSLSLSKPFAGELHGHLGLVTDCVFAWRGELVSLDDKRAVRVWNPQKLQCLQSFTIGEEGCSLLVLRAQPYLLTYARMLDFYRLRTNSKADLQSQVGSAGRDGRNVLALDGQGDRLLAVQFSPYYCFLVVLTSQQLKIFDVNTASSIAAIRPPSSFKFLSAAMKGSRRVLLATSAGTVQERKIEDGQLVRSIQVCSDAQAVDLKFLFYHEQTKMLLAVVEGETMSKILTFELLSEEAERVKEIQFQQVGLQELRRFPIGHRFFILSADPAITVWDYQKLAIINRIDLTICVPEVISGAVSVIAEHNNECLLVHSGKGVGLLFLDNTGVVSEVITLPSGEDIDLSCAALLLQRIPLSFLQEEQARRTKREMQFEGKKKVDFQMFDKETESPSPSDALQDIFILALVSKKGEINYYKLGELLTQTEKIEDAPLRGKAQHVRQHRRAHMRPFLWSNKRSSFDISSHKFTEEYGFISGVESAGTVLGHLYFHNSNNQLLFTTPYAQVKGEWALSLPKPKVWGIAYNQIQQVLCRLDKTVNVLQQINQVPAGRFKTDFLSAKYLTPQQLQQIGRAQQRAKKEASKSSAAFFSRQQLGSRKSIVSINEQIALRDKSKEDQGRKIMVNPAFKKPADNLFDKKLQEQEKRCVVHRNGKELFQKVQRSLSYSRLQRQQPNKPLPQQSQQRIPQPPADSYTFTPEKSSFAAQMDIMLNSVLKQTDPFLLQNSSIKSTKKYGSRGGSAGRPQSNAQFRTHSSGLKTRIKSSLGELSKNFTAGKIQLHNFRRGLGGGLSKKGKLKL